MAVHDDLIHACEARAWTVAVSEGDQGSTTTVVAVANEKVGIA